MVLMRALKGTCPLLNDHAKAMLEAMPSLLRAVLTVTVN